MAETSMPRSRKNLPIYRGNTLFFSFFLPLFSFFLSLFFFHLSPLLFPFFLFPFLFFFSFPPSLDTVNAQNLCTDVNLLPLSPPLLDQNGTFQKGMADPLSSSTLVRVSKLRLSRFSLPPALSTPTGSFEL